MSNTTIAENIVRAKEDYDRVHKAGYQRGQQSMIDPSKIIEKTATGTGIVALDDVSELPHEISVKLSSDTITDFSGKKVTVYGKNLLDQSQELKLIFNGVSYGYSLDLPAGRYTVSAKVLQENTSDYIYMPSSLDYLTVHPRLVTLGKSEAVVIDLKDGQPLRIYDAGKLNSSNAKKMFARYAIQVEAGGNDTPVEPYIAPTTYTANADGVIEGIKSISPYMTFVCEDGIDISVIYRVDWGIVTTRESQWNGFTNYETRTEYPYGFYGTSYLHPLTDVNVVGGASYLFGSSKILDLSACFKKYGTKLDTSKATNMSRAFQSAAILVVPEISLIGVTSSSGVTSMFNSSKARMVEMLVFKDDGSTPVGEAMFAGASNLREIRIRGIIGETINFGGSPLSRESIDNIFDHLKPFGTVWTETTKTSWNEDGDGKYPCDKIKIVLKEIPEDVTSWFVRYQYGEEAGNATGERFFNENGEVEFDATDFVFSSDGTKSGYLSIWDEIENYTKDYSLSVSVDCTVYEGIIHEAPATPPSVTFNQSAVDAAYTAEEWDAKVARENKGWTIRTV